MAINQTSSFPELDFTNECMEILKKPGLFECCCISLHDGWLSHRIYQTGKTIETGMPEIPNPVLAFIRETEEASGLSLFDCSRRKGFPGLFKEQDKDVSRWEMKEGTLYSVSFRVMSAKERIGLGRMEGSSAYCSESDTCSGVAKAIAMGFHTVANPIIQKGFLLTAEGKVLEKKFYYTLVSDGRSRNPEKRMRQYISMHVEVQNLYKRIFGAKAWTKLGEVVESCLAKGLRPFLVGINEGQDGAIERKLYLVSESRDRVSAGYALGVLNLNRNREMYRLAECFIKCSAMDLYLRGIGISLVNGNLHWRYYWFRK